MSSTIHSEPDEDFDDFWETLGLEDTRVEVARTVTVGTRTRVGEATKANDPTALPRLLEDASRNTIPEIRFKDTLGEGGMGVVSLATQVPLGRDVAVKGLKEGARNENMRLALLREGWMTGLLEHPNIVPIYTLGRDEDDEPLIVMKRIEGTSWLELLRDPSNAPRDFDSDRPLDWHIDILAQVCNAVHFAHSKGIIHRDLKPENVMIGAFGEVYVLDWGIAVSLEEDPDGRLPSVEDVSSPAGTPAYMAPEMVSQDGVKLSAKTDVYLLGAMLHEVLTGEPPHQGTSLYEIMFQAFRSQPKEYDASVPQPLVDICHRAMAADPAERFESAEAFRHALVEYKRHSEATRLAEEGQRRASKLRELLEASDEDASEAQIYKVFGESRFGFEQALRVEADNQAARDGLQDVLEMMAERELDRGAYQAASLLIADLPENNPRLEQRLAELGEQLSNREQELEELRQIQHEVDTELGRATRSKLVVGLGIFWAVSVAALALARDFGGYELTYPKLMTHAASLLGMLGAGIYLGRRSLLQNSVNRRMTQSIFAMFIGAVIFRFVAWMMAMPLMGAIALELLFLAVSAVVMALALDRRVLWAAIPYVICVVIASFVPDYLLYIFAGTNVVAMGLLAWRLWPRDDEEG